MAMMRNWVSADGGRELRDLHVQDGGVLLHLEDDELELAAGEIHRVRGGGVLEQVDDLVAGDLLRIEEEVDAHVLEHQFVLRIHVGEVIDARRHALRADLLRQHGADDVDGLGNVRVDGDQQVGRLRPGLAQHGDGGRVPLDGNNVRRGGKLRDPRRVRVTDDDVVGFVAQHLREV